MVSFCAVPFPTKSRWEDPHKLTELSPRSHPIHLMGKGTAQKDTIKDITSDSQVNRNFPCRWSPASLRLNIYFYLFIYIIRVTLNNKTPHLKSQKNQSRRAALGRPAIKLLGWWGGLELVCGRPTLSLSSAFVHQTLEIVSTFVFSHLSPLTSFSVSLGDDPIYTEILSQRAFKPNDQPTSIILSADID